MARGIHYHVCDGLAGGYLPNDVATFTTLRDAREYAASQAKDARWSDYVTHGSARSGLIYYGPKDGDEYAFVIDIMACNDGACWADALDDVMGGY